MEPDGVIVTFAELGYVVDRMADQLRSRGVDEGSIVLIEGMRRTATVAALLATLAVGATYVPGDPTWPDQRFRQIAGIVQPDLVLTERDLGEPALVTATVAELSSPLVEAPIRRGGGPRPETIAYIIFTSGSTGSPKGVKVSHRSVLGLLEWFWSMTAPGDLAMAATTTSLAFDPSVLELYGVLLRGGSVKVTPTVWECNEGAGEVTFIASTPAVLRTLLDTHRLPDSLRLVVSGGESMVPSLARDLLCDRPQLRLWNVYGPTEATVLVTAYEVQQPVPERIPIGRPTAACEIRLVEASGKQTGVGEVGEICILGAQLAAGYVDATSGVGEISGFVTIDGDETMYKTGDLGRVGDDGLLYFEGRRDQQLKVRGHRIEPGEIEAALLDIQGVYQARVSVVGEGPGRRLVAFVSGPDLEVAALRTWLAARLPDFMVPSQIVITAAFPLMSTGKVDVALLTARALEEFRSSLDGRHDPAAYGLDGSPPGPGFEEVTAIIGEVLHRPGGQFFPGDDFFSQLGGTSLQLITILSRIERCFGIEVRLDAVVQDTTVGGLVRTATGYRNGQSRSSIAGPVTQGTGHLPSAAIFLVHSYFGGMLRYHRLRDYLAADFDVHMVDAQMLGRHQTAQHDVGALSRQALQQILEQQPEGPYRLVGHSAGGLIALEAARSLEEAGMQVSYLGLIDSPMIGSRWKHLWAEAVQNLPELLRGAGLGSRVVSRIKRTGPSSADDRVLRQITAVNHGTNLAMKSFRPQPYEQDVVVFRTKEGRRMACWRDDLGWGDALPFATYHEIAGGHVTALDEPHVQGLARQIVASVPGAPAVGHGNREAYDGSALAQPVPPAPVGWPA